MQQARIRPLAICVFRKGERILVAEGYDRVKGEVFHRPLGGAIKFGEYAQEALAREIQEELGKEISDLRYLGTLENLFTYEGQQGHEIVLVYDGAFADQSIYEQESITGREDDDTSFTAVWKALADFQEGGTPLYPDGLLELLTQTPRARAR